MVKSTSLNLKRVSLVGCFSFKSLLRFEINMFEEKLAIVDLEMGCINYLEITMLIHTMIAQHVVLREVTYGVITSV